MRSVTGSSSKNSSAMPRAICSIDHGRSSPIRDAPERKRTQMFFHPVLVIVIVISVRDQPVENSCTQMEGDTRNRRRARLQSGNLPVEPRMLAGPWSWACACNSLMTFRMAHGRHARQRCSAGTAVRSTTGSSQLRIEAVPGLVSISSATIIWLQLGTYHAHQAASKEPSFTAFVSLAPTFTTKGLAESMRHSWNALAFENFNTSTSTTSRTASAEHLRHNLSAQQGAILLNGAAARKAAVSDHVINVCAYSAYAGAEAVEHRPVIVLVDDYNVALTAWTPATTASRAEPVTDGTNGSIPTLPFHAT